MKRKNVDWSEKYLLPSNFGHTSIDEIIGAVTGEEPAGINWWVEDNLYSEEEETYERTEIL